MTIHDRYDRRTVLRTLGAGAIATSLAGCSGSEPTASDEEGGDEDADDAESDGTETDDEADSDTSVPDAVDTFLTDNNAGGYDETAVDATGEESVSIEVGAGDVGLQFAPPAVRVDTGTTLVWEWTGEGGEHNVLADETSDFDVDPESELIDEAGHTAEATFDEPGNFLYYCEPHLGNGKVGAVIVE